MSTSLTYTRRENWKEARQRERGNSDFMPNKGLERRLGAVGFLKTY